MDNKYAITQGEMIEVYLQRTNDSGRRVTRIIETKMIDGKMMARLDRLRMKQDDKEWHDLGEILFSIRPFEPQPIKIGSVVEVWGGRAWWGEVWRREIVESITKDTVIFVRKGFEYGSKDDNGNLRPEFCAVSDAWNIRPLEDNARAKPEKVYEVGQVIYCDGWPGFGGTITKRISPFRYQIDTKERLRLVHLDEITGIDTSADLEVKNGNAQ